jgi:hypothetical protein
LGVGNAVAERRGDHCPQSSHASFSGGGQQVSTSQTASGVEHAPDGGVVGQMSHQRADPPVRQDATVEVEQVDPVPQQVRFEGFGGRLVREEKGDRYRFPRPSSFITTAEKSSASAAVVASPRQVAY